MSPRLALALLAVLPIAARAAAGTIQFTGTVETDRVVISVTIEDDGGAPGVTGFWISRAFALQTSPHDLNHLWRYIPRTPGGSTSYEFVDDQVGPDRTVVYDLYGSAGLPLPDQMPFLDAFQNAWRSGYRIYANMGPNPSYLGSGRLLPGYGEPCCNARLAFSCRTDLEWPLCIVPSEFQPFIDSGEGVNVYGHMFHDIQHGDFLVVEAVTANPCPPLAVAVGTWSTVKLLYLDPAR